jgi:hypothetical protein
MFINDRYPQATNPDGTLVTDKDWTCVPTRVKRRVTIGSGAVILDGVTIGEGRPDRRRRGSDARRTGRRRRRWCPRAAHARPALAGPGPMTPTRDIVRLSNPRLERIRAALACPDCGGGLDFGAAIRMKRDAPAARRATRCAAGRSTSSKFRCGPMSWTASKAG